MNRSKFNIIPHIFMIALGCITVLPFLVVLSASLSSEKDLFEFGYSLVPKHIDTSAYKYILETPKQLIDSYWVTILITILGTVLSVFIMTLTAYALSRPNFKYRKQLTFYIFFTMLFSGGLVPTYLIVTKYLNLTDTIWAMILPSLVYPYYIIILRTFFQKLPFSLAESAKLDGASEWLVLLKIILPLATPALATVTFMIAMAKWNDWYSALLYIRRDSLLPLQALLQRILINLQLINSGIMQQSGYGVQLDIPGESARMAMVVLAAGPMLFVFPFFQKYFVSGLTVGAVKG